MLDKMAGTRGAQGKLWVSFSDAALALLRSGEDPFALMAHITDCTHEHWDQEDKKAAKKA